MDGDTHFENHIEILSIIKDKLNQIPDESLERAKGEQDASAQFVFLQYLKEVVDDESAKWIKHYMTNEAERKRLEVSEQWAMHSVLIY